MQAADSQQQNTLWKEVKSQQGSMCKLILECLYSAMTYEELVSVLEGSYLKHLRNLTHPDLQEAIATLTGVATD